MNLLKVVLWFVNAVLYNTSLNAPTFPFGNVSLIYKIHTCSLYNVNFVLNLTKQHTEISCFVKFFTCFLVWDNKGFNITVDQCACFRVVSTNCQFHSLYENTQHVIDDLLHWHPVQQIVYHMHTYTHFVQS